MTTPDVRRRHRAPRRPVPLVPWLPAMAVCAYIVATAGGYLAIAAGDPSAPLLGGTAAFVAAVVIVFMSGYTAYVWSQGRAPAVPLSEAAVPPGSPTGVPPVHLVLVTAAAAWWLLFGVVSMATRGISDPVVLLARVTDPRNSYYGKFSEVGGSVSPVLQLLTAFGLLYWILIPFTVIYWGRLQRWARVLALTGVASYALLFLGTGTQKGIVDICLQGTVSLVAVAIARGHLTWRLVGIVATVAVLALGLVATSLGHRTDSSATIMQLPGKTQAANDLSAILGEDTARGVVVVTYYVTHGYRGLGYALELPFEWTDGVGSMRSLSSYLPQYLGVPDPSMRSYPVRIERAYGWSATEKWSTVYPWLASDLTFPGTVLLFGALGWLLARVWLSFLRRPDPWALTGLVVLGVFFTYSAANNQLFNDRYTALGVLQLLVVLGVRAARGRLRHVDELDRFVHRACAWVVRTATRWQGRLWLEAVNRVSRRSVVDVGSKATVSVTTFAGRLGAAHVALESIARGTERPGRLVLWVDADVAARARETPGLRRLARRGMEIREADRLLGPHKKYVHVIEGADLDELLLVVADDDIIYPSTWLAELLERFDLLGRRSVVSWWVKGYRFDDEEGSLAPYRTWPSVQDRSVSAGHYLMGGSGTAFPTAVLQALRSAGRAFLEITPTADDVWLNLLTLRAGVGVAQVRDEPLPIITVPMTQGVKLSKANVAQDLNDDFLRAAFTADDLDRLRSRRGLRA